MTEHNHEQETELSAEERRAQLPGLGYTDKFAHGDTEPADPEAQDTEDGEENHEPPSPSPVTTTPPPPASQPWTLGQHGGE